MVSSYRYVGQPIHPSKQELLPLWRLTPNPGVWLRILRTDHSTDVRNSWPPSYDLWQSTRRMLTYASYQYDPITTQLRSVPPWAASFVYALLIAVLSDMFRHRYLFALVSMLISFAGYAILINVHNNRDLQYAALFLACMGTYGAMPILVCWFNMCVSPFITSVVPREMFHAANRAAGTWEGTIDDPSARRGRSVSATSAASLRRTRSTTRRSSSKAILSASPSRRWRPSRPRVISRPSCWRTGGGRGRPASWALPSGSGQSWAISVLISNTCTKQEPTGPYPGPRVVFPRSIIRPLDIQREERPGLT